jgi:hypothetical protein
MKSFYQIINEENFYTDLREVEKRLAEIDVEKEHLNKKREDLLKNIKDVESSGGIGGDRKFIIAKNVRGGESFYYITIDEGGDKFTVIDKNLKPTNSVLPKEYAYKISPEERKALLKGDLKVWVALERFGEYKLKELGLTERNVEFT